MAFVAGMGVLALVLIAPLRVVARMGHATSPERYVDVAVATVASSVFMFAVGVAVVAGSSARVYEFILVPLVMGAVGTEILMLVLFVNVVIVDHATGPVSTTVRRALRMPGSGRLDWLPLSSLFTPYEALKPRGRSGQRK